MVFGRWTALRRADAPRLHAVRPGRRRTREAPTECAVHLFQRHAARRPDVNGRDGRDDRSGGAGLFVKPAASNALMMTLGGGVAIPIARNLSADAAYRYSRINADAPVNTQGLTFGVGYRF